MTRTLFARGSHADNIEAGVHVVHLTRDSGCQWRAKVNRGVANICRANVAAQRAAAENAVCSLRKSATPAAASVRIALHWVHTLNLAQVRMHHLARRNRTHQQDGAQLLRRLEAQVTGTHGICS